MATVDLTGKMLSRRRVVAAKIESVEGTMETITVSEAGILVRDPKFDPDVNMFDRNVVSVSLSPFKDRPGTRMATLSFQTELIGSPNGSSYAGANQPALDVYLRACGFQRDVAGDGSTVKYYPRSSGLETITIWLYADGVVYKMYGCRGNVKFSGNVGEPCMAEFSFQGVFDSVADTAIVSPTYGTAVPPPLLSATISLMDTDLYRLICASFELDMNNQLQMRQDTRQAAGFRSCLLTGRKLQGKIDPEMDLVATHPFHSRWMAGTSAALQVGTVGSTQYNRFTIYCPAVVYTKIGDTDRTGISVADLSFMCARTSADNEIYLTFS
jgi:hypothetical protein